MSLLFDLPKEVKLRSQLHFLQSQTSINMLSVSCLLQILHSVKGCVKGLCYYALRDYTGKTCGLKVRRWCTVRTEYMLAFILHFLEKYQQVQSDGPSAADICGRQSGSRWYHPSLFCSRSRLLGGLSSCYCQYPYQTALFCVPTHNTPVQLHTEHSAVMWCWMCLLSLQKHCTTSEYTEVLHPLLGLITNVSTITSPVTGVRHVMCNVNRACT